MKTRSHLVAVAAAWGCLPLFSASIPDSFPPLVKVVIHANVPKVRAIPVLRDFLARKTGGLDKLIQNVKTWVGVDLDSVTTCWIGVEKKDHMLLVLQGRFDEQHIENAVLNIDTAQVVQRPGVPFAVMLPDNKRPGEFNLGAVLNDHTVVFGRPELVDDFLAVFTGTQPGLPPDKIKRLAAMADSQAALDAVVFGLPEKQLRKNPWLGLFSVATLSADLQDSLRLTLRLGVKKPQAAEPIRKIIEGFRDVYACLDPSQRKLGKIPELLLENAKVKVDGAEVVVDVTIPAQTFDRVAREKLLR